MTVRRISLGVCAIALLALIEAPAGALQRGAPAGGTLVVKDVTLIDGTDAAPRAHVSLVVRDGTIASIVPAGSEPTSQSTDRRRGPASRFPACSTRTCTSPAARTRRQSPS